MDKEQSFNDCRNKAAQLAASVFQGLQSSSIASQIGRFDDQFDPNCVGDAFQSLGVPTLLIEAGHYQDDYQREKTRTFVFNAYVLALQAIGTSNFSNFSIYHSIPQNKKIFFDYLFRNVRYVDRGKEKTGDVGLQYKEVLNSNQIEFHLFLLSLEIYLKLMAISSPIVKILSLLCLKSKNPHKTY